MGKAENDLQTACLSYLAMRGVMAWRNNTGARPIQEEGRKRRYIKFGATGSGDILAVVPPKGTFLNIECKVRGKYPSKVQREWAECVRESGGVAIVAYEIEDVQKAVDAIRAQGGSK